MSDSRYLLKSLLDKDSRGIQEIYEVVYPRVKQFVLANTGTEDDAQDVFQKVLLQLIARVKVQNYQLIDSFEAYVFTACKNLWKREINRRKRVTNITCEEHKVIDAETIDLAEALIDQERWELYRACFARLSDNCKKILGMYFEKEAYSKMKKVFSYSSETVVRQRVFKCKARLSELIRKSDSYKYLKNDEV